MSVYVDSLVNHGWKLGPNCHLIADTEDELHDFAQRIGLKRTWAQLPPHVSLAHYDLTEKNRTRAIALGAVALERRPFVEKIRAIREAKAVQL